MESSAQSKINPVLLELGGLFHRRLDAIDRGKDYDIQSKLDREETNMEKEGHPIQTMSRTRKAHMRFKNKTNAGQTTPTRSSGKERNSETHEESPEVVYVELDDNNAMVQHLAPHVLCSAQFHSAMTADPQAPWRQITLQELRLPDIHLRSHEYTFDERFISQTSCIEFLTAPKPFFMRLTLRWNDIIAPPAIFNQKWNDLREDLFRYHVLRVQLLVVAKRVEEQLITAKKPGLGPCGEWTRQEGLPQSKLGCYERAANECQRNLGCTVLEERIISAVDQLLVGWTTLDNPECAYTGGRHRDQHPLDVQESHEAFVDRMKEQYGFEQRYNVLYRLL
jgi:hypothetical protein